MTLLLIGIAFDVAQLLGFIPIFLFYLASIYLNGGKISPMTIFVFFGGLGLRLISRRGIVVLSLFFNLGNLIELLPVGGLIVFFDQWKMAFWASGINLPNCNDLVT